jgi:hypothetical protein
MAKATILSNLGDGLYEVRQDIGTAEANSAIASLQASITALDAQIITATTERNDIAANLATAQSIYDAAVTAYEAAVAADPKASTKAWEAANVELVRQQLLLADAQRELSRLQANRAQLARDLNALQDASFQRDLQAWCVDYTDDATGEVATIEIPGEPKYTLIAPGARAHTAADGRLLARQVMTGPQAYFNAAILPGWQKFKPTYRRGTITAIDGDVATVALADDRSSAQNLAINQASTLAGVPIVYQDCNGEVFEVGDECVVEFQGQDWNNPKVIGFQSNPIACDSNFPGFFLGYGNVKIQNGPIGVPVDPSAIFPGWTIRVTFTYLNDSIAWQGSPGWLNLGPERSHIIVAWTNKFTLVDGVATPYIKPEWEQQIRDLVPAPFKTAHINPVLMRRQNKDTYGISVYPVVGRPEAVFNDSYYRTEGFSVPLPWRLASIDITYGNIEISGWSEMTAEVTNESLVAPPTVLGAIQGPITNPYKTPKRWTNPLDLPPPII